jgi:hypothetical protein
LLEPSRSDCDGLFGAGVYRRFALEVYAKKMARSRETSGRLDALIRGPDWAAMGTNGATRCGERDPAREGATDSALAFAVLAAEREARQAA